MTPLVIYQSGRKPRRSGYITQRLLDELGSRQAALEWLNAQDRKEPAQCPLSTGEEND